MVGSEQLNHNEMNKCSTETLPFYWNFAVRIHKKAESHPTEGEKNKLATLMILKSDLNRTNRKRETPFIRARIKTTNNL